MKDGSTEEDRKKHRPVSKKLCRPCLVGMGMGTTMTDEQWERAWAEDRVACPFSKCIADSPIDKGFTI